MIVLRQPQESTPSSVRGEVISEDVSRSLLTYLTSIPPTVPAVDRGTRGQSGLAACEKCTYGLGQPVPLRTQEGEGAICLVVKRHSTRPTDEQGLAGRNPPQPVLPPGDGGGIRAREQQLVRGPSPRPK